MSRQWEAFLKLLGKLSLGLALLAVTAIGTPALASSFTDNFNAENGGVGALNYNAFAN